MTRVKNFSSKTKARLSSLLKALLRRKSKASTTVVGTTASNEESHDSSLQPVEDAKAQPTEDGNVLSGEASKHESSGPEEDRPQYRQLPSFGSLSRIMICSSSQFDLPDLSNANTATLESYPGRTESSPTTSEMEGSADAASEIHSDHGSSSTTNFDSEYAVDAGSEIYAQHEISSATDFDSENFGDASATICENDGHDDAESQKIDTTPKIRIPMVERSETCLFPRPSNSRNSISMGNEDATFDNDEEDGRYYGFCCGFDFSDSLVVLEDANVRVSNVEEAEDVDEEFVKAWRERHGYED